MFAEWNPNLQVCPAFKYKPILLTYPFNAFDSRSARLDG